MSVPKEAPDLQRSEKKRRREEAKLALDEYAHDGSRRRHKKSKSIAKTENSVSKLGDLRLLTTESARKKHKKQRLNEDNDVTKNPKSKRKKQRDGGDNKQIMSEARDVPCKFKQQKRKDLDIERWKEKNKKNRSGPVRGQDDDAMDIDVLNKATKTVAKKNSMKAQDDEQFPFFEQTISLYVPFFPQGFDKPITSAAAQHLDPLLNHYNPTLHGVLLSYKNVNLSEIPARPDAHNLPTDETHTTLKCGGVYGVGFGYITADLTMFVPLRGSLMEGEVKLQNEGHVGVVCFNKFNASIEAKRLPLDWKWINTTDYNNGMVTHARLREKTELDGSEADFEGQQESGDMVDGEGLPVQQQHSTGYWVDGDGFKIGAKLRFRISNFDTGMAGDLGYLSIQGTMLSVIDEKALMVQERAEEKRRWRKHNVSGQLRPLSKRVPEHSMTKFGQDKENYDSA